MTAIQWTQMTWNPIAGCSMVSPGCTNCYAMRQAHRNAAMGMAKYHGLTHISGGRPVWTGKVRLADARTMSRPLSRREPTFYFVNSMSDLFHEDVETAWIDTVFAVMAQARSHTFQILTKRAERMRSYMADPQTEIIVLSAGLFKHQTAYLDALNEVAGKCGAAVLVTANEDEAKAFRKSVKGGIHDA